MLLRRVLRRRLVRDLQGAGLLRRGVSHRRRLEGTQKAETRPFREYDPLCVHPVLEHDVTKNLSQGAQARLLWSLSATSQHELAF